MAEGIQHPDHRTFDEIVGAADAPCWSTSGPSGADRAR